LAGVSTDITLSGSQLRQRTPAIAISFQLLTPFTLAITAIHGWLRPCDCDITSYHAGSH